MTTEKPVAWLNARRKAQGAGRTHRFKLDGKTYSSKCLEIHTTMQDVLVFGDPSPAHRPCITCFQDLDNISEGAGQEQVPEPAPAPAQVKEPVEEVDHAAVREERRNAVSQALKDIGPCNIEALAAAVKFNPLAVSQCLAELAKRGEAHILGPPSDRVWGHGQGTAKQSAKGSDHDQGHDDAPQLVAMVSEKPVAAATKGREPGPGMMKRYTFRWVPSHLGSHKACFESSVLAWDEAEAKAFLKAACQPASISIITTRVDPAT